MTFIRLFGRRPEPPPPPPVDNAPVDAAEAWKAVGLVNDWVKHAETKATGCVAASGVIGGVLYNLVKDEDHLRWWAGFSAVVCAVGIIFAASMAITALWPRLRAKEAPTSSLYFDHIARRHPKSPTGYVSEFRALVMDSEELLRQLAQQVWANAGVARRKHRFAGLAMVGLVIALAGLSVLVATFGLISTGVISGG